MPSAAKVARVRHPGPHRNGLWYRLLPERPCGPRAGPAEAAGGCLPGPSPGVTCLCELQRRCTDRPDDAWLAEAAPRGAVLPFLSSGAYGPRRRAGSRPQTRTSPPSRRALAETGRAVSLVDNRKGRPERRPHPGSPSSHLANIGVNFFDFPVLLQAQESSFSAVKHAFSRGVRNNQRRSRG